MILVDIRNKLEEIDSNVFYGAVDPKMKEIEWNYIVFNRGPLRIGKNRTGYSDYFDIHIVREDYIPEGLDVQIIEKILEIDGMRLADMDGTYDYIYKDKTNSVVEMLSLRFVRARK